MSRSKVRQTLERRELELQAARVEIEQGIRSASALRLANARVAQLEATNASLRAQVAQLIGDRTAGAVALSIDTLLANGRKRP